MDFGDRMGYTSLTTITRSTASFDGLATLVSGEPLARLEPYLNGKRTAVEGRSK